MDQAKVNEAILASIDNGYGILGNLVAAVHKTPGISLEPGQSALSATLAGLYVMRDQGVLRYNSVMRRWERVSV